MNNRSTRERTNTSKEKVNMGWQPGLGLGSRPFSSRQGTGRPATKDAVSGGHDIRRVAVRNRVDKAAVGGVRRGVTDGVHPRVQVAHVGECAVHTVRRMNAGVQIFGEDLPQIFGEDLPPRQEARADWEQEMGEIRAQLEQMRMEYAALWEECDRLVENVYHLSYEAPGVPRQDKDYREIIRNLDDEERLMNRRMELRPQIAQLEQQLAQEMPAYDDMTDEGW